MERDNTNLPEASPERDEAYDGYGGYPSDYGASYSSGDEQSIHDYLRVVVSHRWMIIGITLAILGFALIHSFLATPIYNAAATLKIGTYSPMIPGVSLEDSHRQRTRENDYLNTQINLLTSLTLAEKVLSEGEILEELNQRPAKSRGGMLSVFRPFINLITPARQNPGKKSSRESNYNFPLSQLRSYLGMISISPVAKTTLVKVSVNSSNPELSAKIANLHSQAFIELARTRRQETTLENLVFLKGQAEELAGKVSLMERNIASYAEENAIVSLNEDENIVVKRMAELSELLTKATAQRIQAEQRYKEAESGSAANTSLYDDESAESVEVALKQAETQYAALSEKFKPSYPKMVQLRARIEALEKILKQQREQAVRGLRAEYQSALKTEQQLTEELEIQKSKTFELSRRLVQYNVMKREYESLKDLHQAVLRQLKEAQISAESTGSNISLTDKAAVPLGYASPNRKKNILVALMLGPLIGVVLAFILEALDNTLKTPGDVERYLDLPALGVVPVFIQEDLEQGENPRLERTSHNKNNSDASVGSDRGLALRDEQLLDSTIAGLVTISSPRSISSEAIRTIRTAILLSSAEHPPKVILVTSGKKAEGKTTLISNLAVTLAQSGSKTLLLDADLRRPMVHERFNVDATEPGLVDYLTGSKELADVVHETAVENLSIIPSGPTPPNPVELVGSRRMAETLELLATKYDFVLLDAPPILPVSDAAMLSRVVDGTILVARGQNTAKQIVRDAASRLQRVGANILGVVLNDVDFKRGEYYYYYRDAYAYYYEDERRHKKSSAAS